tara:strand:- start:3220 stop:3459 length:240 start_codon:yes stop_codon:yes gene_type:complete
MEKEITFKKKDIVDFKIKYWFKKCNLELLLKIGEMEIDPIVRLNERQVYHIIKAGNNKTFKAKLARHYYHLVEDNHYEI